ncbi:prolyl oligopeptidase family serine peptidase [Roseateles sp. DC23W]|uniref:Prolyl oligopeptidase family serine peptidase n=1 Tax=Pelomonas dachongensis TaxID=3299029 RepID=A0ABW7ERG6_9BURK
MTRLMCYATLALSLLGASAQAAPPPAALFFRAPDIAEAVLSPSGRQLAFTTARDAGRVGLVVLDLDSGKATRAAQYSAADVIQVQWVNEQRLVYSVLDVSAGSASADGYPGLFAIDADGTDMLPLVQRDGSRGGELGWRKLKALHPNHGLLRVPAQRDGEAADEVLMVRNDGALTPLWLNTRTGDTRPVPGDVPENAVRLMPDSRGELRAALTLRGGRLAALWRAPGRGDWQRLYEIGEFDRPPFQIEGFDDQGQLFVSHHPGDGAAAVLSRYDFERRAPEPKPLLVTPGFDFEGDVVVDSHGAALGVQFVTDAESTHWFHPALKALQKEADTPLPERVNRIQCRRCGQPDMVALVLSYSDHDPGQLWLYRAQPQGGSRWSQAGRVRNDVRPADMAAMYFERITARDGADLPVWVTRRADADGPLPAVVLVHGGPWVRGGVWSWRAEAQFLASRGYVVIEPEFRGSLGFGEAHYRAGFKQWGQAMQNDVADALKWAQAEGIASDKACIAGASYGGYSALMGLVNDPGLYRCGAAWLAVTDLELLLKGPRWVNDDTGRKMRKFRMPEMIGDLDKDAAMIVANSPVKQAARIQAPLLLAYGEADRRVPLVHGERLQKAMREAGQEPTWVTYRSEGHGFAALRNRVDFAQRLEAFLAQHLK